MSKKTMSNPIARLAYMMTSFPKINMLIFRKMIADSKIFASQHFFETFVGIKNVNGKFIPWNLRSRFIYSDSEIQLSIIDTHVKLSDREKEIIKNRAVRVFPFISWSGLVALWLFASLIKTHSHYPYVVMPIILNYGRDKKLSHQAVFMYDNTGKKMIFYEPYGTYEKYGVDYSQVFDKMNYILTGVNQKTHMFHRLYDLGIGSQMIIINQNNKNKSEFDEALAEIKNIYDKTGAVAWDPPKKYNKEFDHTIESIRILDEIEIVAEKYGAIDLLHMGYDLFHTYSAKICVALTVTELYIFSQKGSAGLKKFYAALSSSHHPSKLAIDMFGQVLKSIYGEKLLLIKSLLSNYKLDNATLAKYLTSA